jgi:hypothetical protein
MFETELQRMSQLASLVVVVLGLWVVVTPWFWGTGGAGFFGGERVVINWLFWSNTVAGLVIAGIAARTTLQIEKEIHAG